MWTLTLKIKSVQLEKMVKTKAEKGDKEEVERERE